jgi:hypothetical protein
MGAVKTGFVDAGLGDGDAVARRLHQGLLDLHAGLGVVELLAAHQERIPGAEPEQAIQVAPRLGEVGRLLGLLGPGLGQGRLGTREGRAVLVGLEPQERLAGHHVVALVHEELLDPTLDVGADVHRTTGADVAAGRDDLLEVASLDGLDPDLDALVPLPHHRQHGCEGEHRGGRDADDDLRSGFHVVGAQSWKRREAPMSASRFVTASW